MTQEIEEAVQAIAKKYGVDIKQAGASFSDIDAIVKLEIKTKGTKAKEAHEMSATILGLPKDIVGKNFKQRASTFTVTSLDMKKIKYPVIAVNQNGKSYKFTVDSVKSLMGLR